MGTDEEELQLRNIEHWTLNIEVKSSATVIEIDYFIVFIETDVIRTNIIESLHFPICL